MCSVANYMYDCTWHTVLTVHPTATTVQCKQCILLMGKLERKQGLMPTQKEALIDIV